jgi:hypothetical protein
MPRIIKLAKGSFTVSSITVDSTGRVVTASSGTAGGGANELALAAIGGQSGTYTATANANRIAAYMAAGGGGGGSLDSPDNSNSGGDGGDGGFGLFSFSIPGHPFSQPYAAGSGGAGNTTPNGVQGPGVSGGQTTIANVGTANGGGAGVANNDQNGSDGTAPSATLDLTPSPGPAREIVIPGITGQGGQGKQSGPQGGGQSGNTGALLVYENKGT